MSTTLTMTEADLEAAVEQLARLRGWLVYHTRRSTGSVAGFPDLILLRGERILAVELKRDGKQPTPAQMAWLTAFDAAHAETHVWRPKDWRSGAIDDRLGAPR